MSFTVSIYCPHCAKYTALSQALTPQHIPCSWNKSHIETWWIGICNSCQKPLLVQNWERTVGTTMYPNPLPSDTDERIPEEIRIDLIESKLCFSAHAYRGCTVLARRAIQSTCLDKGAITKDLVKQIDELFTLGIITADLKEWAHVIRWVGNDAAHPNKEAVTVDDATDILELCEQFLHTIYVAPAIASERRKIRNK
jgi:hypothetical protein